MNHLIKPIERLVDIPVEISGQQGFNRAPQDKLQIPANSDLQAIKIWLRRYDQSAQTLRSYRKEIERLYLWSLYQTKPFSSLTVDDIQTYLKFIKNPQPQQQWCGPRRPRSDPRWRPFEKPLGEASQKQTMTILGTCFSFLVDAGYLVSNPIKLLGQSSRPKPYRSAVVERYIDQSIWQYFWQALVNQPVENQQQQKYLERNRFIFTLLYEQSPRASEVVNHCMNSIVFRHHNWWWQITGKGGRTEQIPWTETCMQALVRYRRFRNLADYPDANDYAPLVAQLSSEKGIKSVTLYKIIKKQVTQVADQLALIDSQAAQQLRKASTHWFRHTSLTHRANAGVDLRFLQALARHKSLDTTQRYLHVERDAFHQAINQTVSNKKS